MATYEFEVEFNCMCHVTVGAMSTHDARVQVTQMQTALLDEIGNWPTTELMSLDTKMKVSQVIGDS
jgi:hypothetical protein